MLKDILKKKGTKIAAAVLAAVLVIALSAHFLGGRVSFLQDAVDTIMQPFEKGATKAALWLERIYSYMYEHDKLVAENENLKLRVSELEKLTAQYDAAIEENERLRELLNFKDDNTEFEFLSADITAWTPSNWSLSFTISKGSASDIEVGDCVIDQYGNLVGQITELGTNSATVQAVTDPSFEAGAIIKRSGCAGIIKGEYSYFTRSLSKFENFPSGSDILLGDEVITSGKGGVLPRGLRIGTIYSVESDSSGLSQHAVIRPSVDFSSISAVYVVTNFGEVGQE